MYENLAPEEQAIVRHIFLRLTELGEGTEDTRRRVSFDELNAAFDRLAEGQTIRQVLML